MATTHTISSTIQRDVLLDKMLRAFSRRIIPILSVSTIFRNIVLNGTNKIDVPYFALDTGASTDFVAATGYAFSGTTATSYKQVNVNKRKYQPLSWTSDEERRQPAFNPEQLFLLKAEKLAEDVLADIFSVVTAANYGAAVVNQSPATFDLDDVEDLKVACSEAMWPATGRGLVLDSSPYSYLMRDGRIGQLHNYGTNEAVQQGEISTPVAGFKSYEVPSLPMNGENLMGFAVWPSAICVAFSPIQPTAAVQKMLVDYRALTDPKTGLTLEYRVWGNPDMDETRETIECNYGYAVGETQALKRITKP